MRILAASWRCSDGIRDANVVDQRIRLVKVVHSGRKKFSVSSSCHATDEEGILKQDELFRVNACLAFVRSRAWHSLQRCTRPYADDDRLGALTL